MLIHAAVGSAGGIDTTKSLLALAPPSEDVEYRHMQEGAIPVEDSSVDLVWIVLVLGGITPQDVLTRTLDEIDRLLVPGGLVFLAEATSQKPDAQYWVYRSVDDYARLFSVYSLTHERDYFDLDDRISILVGRKPDH